MLYLIVFISLVVFMNVFFEIAKRYKIVDKPNNRSSHSYITIRGGGIIFPVSVFLWHFLSGSDHMIVVGALFVISIISFFDDFYDLSSKIRIIVHFVSVSCLFYTNDMFGLGVLSIVLAYLFAIGWINAFNFMDGINGITAFYSMTALVSFSYLNSYIMFTAQDLVRFLMISVLIFTFYNVRKKAKTFAGDIGSVSMAFMLLWFMIELMIKTGRIEYILFYSIYGIDSVFTILYRLKRKENIFKAHRTHFYQLLSNELRWPHIQVSLLYAVVQSVINILTIWCIDRGYMSLNVLIFFVGFLSSLYVLLRKKVVGVV